ncbi:IclR family transcriptional regulator [Pectobacterium zantedeschiae]|uniref:IclR family transcriptional regulator n=1 Tax=Pectobacterium zantedeschiae TaxID=2034769 RepID=A0A9X8P604_9GAMM|nr:helix-turn-helix domain-containing protein [Pectobacterium zantedeschiae]RYC38338.1 IclR family transcriptional regulator [Pectobacterium zantedeschiae]RYC44983.1 IclR family transcriptional regulator [Pectobacterium zantedeschiae]RYC48000.1 IclR family transcriptional regulator [Pectobacterium zantedeschiae]
MSREKSTDIDRSVKAVKRTLAILDAFIPHPGGITLGELEAATGLFKSVIMRYMLSLEAEHYIFKRTDGRYELGSRAYQLGCAYERTFNLHRHVLPVLEKLTAATLESSTFYVRDGANRMCLLRQDSPHHIKSSVPVGTLLAMDDTSAASVLRQFEQGVPPDWDYRQGLFTSSGAGLNRLQAASLLTSSISVPVFKHDNQLAGALSISGPTSRFVPEDAASQQLLLDAAKALSIVLGALLPD